MRTRHALGQDCDIRQRKHRLNYEIFFDARMDLFKGCEHRIEKNIYFRY